MQNFDQELDASGMSCPLPIIKATKIINGLEAGQVLKVIATDPGSVADFKAYAEQTGNKLLNSSREGGNYIYWLEKT
jgi:tRNA 2-thiouridine synthesizing protein A